MFIRLLLSAVMFLPLYSCADDTQKTTEELETLEQKASYSFGVNFSTRIQASQVTFDNSALLLGFSDAIQGKQLKLSTAEMKQANADFLALAKAKLKQDMLEQSNSTLEDGKKFLVDNANKEGVITTDSGLQYKVITAGSGKSPLESDTVVTHYRGTLIDGREFDSSYKRNKPATFPVKGVIKGWTEALQLMKVGAKWQLFIPSNLAYGESKRSELILPNSALVFEIELIEIK